MEAAAPPAATETATAPLSSIVQEEGTIVSADDKEKINTALADKNEGVETNSTGGHQGDNRDETSIPLESATQEASAAEGSATESNAVKADKVEPSIDMIRHVDTTEKDGTDKPPTKILLPPIFVVSHNNIDGRRHSGSTAEPPLILPEINKSSDYEKALKQLGADEDEVKRSTALKKMGVTEDDLSQANAIFAQQATVTKSAMTKEEQLLGATKDQQKRAKALHLLETTESQLDMLNQKKLGELGTSSSTK